jgi:ribosomal protein S12 methylthiotransferase
VVRAVAGEATSAEGDELPTWIYGAESPRVLSTPPWLAYLKIGEGCDYTCSFCIIPRLRGRHRSRSAEDILREAEALAARGVKELVLVSQDSTRWGQDLGIRGGLGSLLRRLGEVDGVRWIRIMYAYPATVTDETLDAIAQVPKVVKYIDIPLQHASEPVLRRMKRPTGRGNLLGLVERMRERVPGLALRTSFIVGFPGETDEDFERLLEFVEAARFDRVGVFKYSDEESTSAFDLEGKLPAGIKERRRRKLMSVQRQIALRRNRELVGRRVEVLVEGVHPETDLLLQGRLPGQAPEVDGSVLIADGTASPGDLVTCEVTEAHPYDLVARIL